MLPDVEPGQLYAFVRGGERKLYEFVRTHATGELELKSVGDRSPTKRLLTRSEYEDERSSGHLVRVQKVSPIREGHYVDDIDPLMLADPDQPGIGIAERIARRAARHRLEEARTLRFYCVLYDELPVPTRATVGLRGFIASNISAAKEAGHDWVPSPSAVLRAVDKYGVPGERPLVAFLSRGRHGPTQRWDRETERIRDETIAYYWSKSSVGKSAAVAFFLGRHRAIAEELRCKGAAAPKTPSKSTICHWLAQSENYDNYASKYSSKAADARFKGRERGRSATRILEYVLFDHTECDAWAAVFNDEGEVITTARPTLTIALDLYSRMILGAVLTYEGPSLHAVMTCLRQVMQKKEFLIQRWGWHKGATDGWGKPGTIIVDKAWELVGLSFQTVCEAAGIDVIWAPVRTPTYKPYVERVLHTINLHVWHRLPSGIPHDGPTTTKMGSKARKLADRDIGDLNELVWNAIVTVYHLERHSGIEMAPARKWCRGGDDRKRPTVDDPRVLDKLIGRSRRALLTAEGVTIDGHRFHDVVVTGRLLDSILRTASKRSQRKGPIASGTVPVLVTISDVDCSAIEVWDPTRRVSETLPNWDSRFVGGMSWRVAKLLKKHVEEQNEAFHSEADAIEAREALRKSLESDLKQLGARSRGRRAYVAAYHRESAALGAGDIVLTDWEAPSPSGLRGSDIPNSLPATERIDARIPPLGPRRGGRKATAKAQATRRRNRQAAEDREIQKRGPRRDPSSNVAIAMPTSPPQEVTADERARAQERLEEIARKLLEQEGQR